MKDGQARASTPIYPAYCHAASPTLNKWVKLTAKDVHCLRQVRGYEGTVQNFTDRLHQMLRHVDEHI